jgi:hypothetical protein
MAMVLSICAIFWGVAATSFAAVTNFPGSFACRFFVGLGGMPSALVIRKQADPHRRGWIQPSHPGVLVPLLHQTGTGLARRVLVGNGAHGVREFFWLILDATS